MSKLNSKALSSSGKSVLEVQHEGISVKGDISLELDDTQVFTTDFDSVGMYIITTETVGDGGLFSVIKTAGTLSTSDISTPAIITMVKDTASSLNIYIEDGVVKVQNLTGEAPDVTIKPYI